MTPLQKIYDAFLAQVQDDEWGSWEEWERQEDWYQLLLAAIVWFKFPRIPLTITEEEIDAIEVDEEIIITYNRFFNNELTNAEIQVIVAFMRAAWLERIVLSWENLRPLYSERDFSPANMLREFSTKTDAQFKLARRLEATYYRTIDGQPFKFRNLSGGPH